MLKHAYKSTLNHFIAHISILHFFIFIKSKICSGIKRTRRKKEILEGRVISIAVGNNETHQTFVLLIVQLGVKERELSIA